MIVKFIVKNEGVDWIHVARDLVQRRTCECHNESSGSVKLAEFLLTD
jgi:hypothetical protein